MQFSLAEKLLLLFVLAAFSPSEGQIEKFCDCPTNRAGEIKEMFQDFVEHFSKTSEDFETCLAENTEKLKEIRSKNRNCIGNSVSDCRDALAGFGQNGVYLIDPSLYFRYNYYAPCRNDLMGGGWMVVLRRLDGRYSFDKNWINYRDGFGNLEHEFFIGLDRLHQVTSASQQQLLFWLEHFDGSTEFALYDHFRVANETELFNLAEITGYTGTSGDFMLYHRNRKFSTQDKPTDNLGKCQDPLNGGWWHNGCCFILYPTDNYYKEKGKFGIIPDQNITKKSGYRKIEMMIRQI